ncbi:MAG: hypothetical protein EOO38_18250 [Cytophagaceae bacterium]|nr:MAG: hypothetical protein EOO38_18250 [Cytophagaceae bacterium]
MPRGVGERGFSDWLAVYAEAMADQLDLFSPSAAPIKWRRPSAATFFIVESKEPDRFEIRCVTVEGKRANLTSTYVAGELVAEAGHFYQAVHWTGNGSNNSPFYDSLQEAKDACETYKHIGAFPEKERQSLFSAGF